LFFNVPLVAALSAMATAQIFKIFLPLFKAKPPRFQNLFDYGGMPSGHTSFIVAMVVAVGINKGWTSSIFAVAAVVAAIMIYDILKLRRTVEANLNTTRELMKKGTIADNPNIPQFRGHTPVEVLVGSLWGVANAVVVSLLWRHIAG
jgi:uncharacterized protein